MRILDIDEIKSFPRNPQSHPFVERVIGTVRREYLDQALFFNKGDLESKLKTFQHYYNETRVHSSLDLKTPEVKANGRPTTKKSVSLAQYSWRSHCKGLYKYPAVA
ncbi:MAG: transposase [Spongiibacteraceae bacterium]|nr:transposase [Spongiibacteraceae bacterium]